MRKKLNYLIIVLITIILLPFSVNAKDGITLQLDKTTLKPGDSITITVDLDYNDSLHSFVGGLSFDENVFEIPETSNFKELDEWSDVVYNKENKKFALLNKSGDTKKHLFMVQLFVKDNPISGKTEISLNNSFASDGKEDIEFNNASKTVTIDNPNYHKESNSYSKSSETKKDLTVKTFKPFIIIGTILLVSILIGIVIINSGLLKETLSFNNERKKKITITLSIIFVMLLIITIILVIMNGNKGDVNKDNKKDYEDAKKINEYLIDITNEVDNENDVPKKNFDVNGDGKITVTDSAQTEKNTTKKTNYKVELKSEKINYYPKKNAEVKLNFTAKINPNNVKIKEVFANGKKIKVSENENGYSINVKAPNKSGIYKYTITKVILTNGREIDVQDLTFKVDVLKDTMKIEDFKYENGSINLAIKDTDKALKNAHIKIVKGIVDINDFGVVAPDDLETQEVVFEQDLDIISSKISIKSNLELGEVYTVLITGNYDLDTNELDSTSNYYQNQNLYYNTFTNGKVTITPLIDLENLYPNQSEIVNFKFKASVTPKEMSQILSKVIIDGVEHKVDYVDGYYILAIDGTTNFGERKHEISSVVLDDGTQVLCNYEIIYTVLKQKFTLTDFRYHDKENKITFTLDDKDKSLNNAKIVITKKGEDRPVFEHELDLTDTNFEYEVKLERGFKYDIKITGNYDLDDDNNNQKNDYTGSLFDYELMVHDVTLEYFKESTYYVNKGEKVELRFKAKAIPEDTLGTVTEVVIEDQTYKPTKYSDGSYGVLVQAPSEAGIKEYNISKVILGDDEISKELSFKVDVLKDKPSIDNFYIEEAENKSMIIFTLNDKDNALKDNAGEVIIKNNDGEVKKFSAKKGLNTIDLNEFASELENGGTYYVDVKANYDLDSSKDNGKYENCEYLISNHEIKIYKAKLTLALENDYYFKKEETKPIYLKAIITQDPTIKIKSFVMKDEVIVDANYENGLYSLKITAPKIAGKDTYNIEKIILTNDIVIDTQLEFTIDVLKDVPYINKINFDDDNQSLSYELVNIDNAFKSGTIEIYDKTNHIVKTEDIKDKASINYNFKENETYKIKITGSYDLDSNYEDNANAYNNIEMYAHTFTIGGDYNFTLTNVTITDALKQNEKPVISFTSTNAKNAKIQKVTLNGKEYDVTNVSRDNYEVRLTDINSNPGKYEVTFDSVKLDTLKTFNNNQDYKVNTLTYTILKDIPSITDIKLSNNALDKTINVKFKLNDSNFSLVKLTIALVDSTDRIVVSRKATMEEIYFLGDDKGIDLSYDKNTDGKYKVKFLANYELGDKYRYNNQNIGEGEILTQNNEIYIDTITLKTSKYVHKNQKNYEISYEVYVGENIKTNNGKTYTRLSGITMNGNNYVSNGESSNRPKIYKAKIGITAPNKSGVLTLNANRVQLELNSYYDKVNDYYSVPNKNIQIEVLKDIPKIENLKIKEENYKEKTVTFEFDVKLDSNAQTGDESFKNGSLTLGNIQETIVRGHNIIKFENVETDKNLDLIFKASYDLDTDALNIDGADENEYTNQEIYKTSYGLFDSTKYSIAITEGKAVSKDNNNYFEKKEEVKLNFNIIGEFEELGLSPQKVIIKDKEYSLTKLESGYQITYDGYNTFGEKQITISSVILNNGKTVKLEKPASIKLEVLKDIPKIINYKYEISGNKINIISDLKDNDGTLISKLKLKITDESGKEIATKDYKNKITFDKTNATRYYVQVFGDYDLDTDITKGSNNYYSNIKLLEEIISLDNNNIELKDINDINLYKKVNSDGKEEIILIEKTSKSEIDENKNAYFVEINMEKMPSVRAKIKEVKENNNHLIFILDYNYVTTEDSKTNDLQIDFGEIQNGVAYNEIHPATSFEVLLKKLQSNENVTLTKNYDASSIPNDTSINYYVESYSGVLDGNGFTITNLKKPLFNNITNATIKNLRFEDVTMPATSGNGTVAIIANNSILQNVIIDKYYKANNESQVGTLLGKVKDSTITSCAAKNFNINAGWANLQQIGGLVGTMDNTTITNSYVIGKIPGGWNFRAGLVGNANNSTIENNYIKVEIGYGMGNDVSYDIASGNNNIFKNNISLATGFKHNMFANFKESQNNYYVDEETATDINQVGVTKITKNAINKELFIETDFLEEIWNLDNVSYDNLPIFQTEKYNGLKGTDNNNFDETKIILYKNLAKLMPFYKTDKIIELAKNINDKDLNSKEIVHILPLDSKGNIVNYLTTDNVKRISKIKIVYQTKEHKEYKVTYDKTYDMVASFRIPDLKIDYNYNHYVIDNNSQVVINLTNYLKSLNYTENLDVLTATADSRIYKDFYNETTSKELKEFVLKFLSNSNYTNTLNDDIINSYIEENVKKNNKIEKILYMYNYLRRFYDLKIDGLNLYDFMLFNMEGFDESLTPMKVTELYFADSNNFATNVTGTKYAEILGSYTKQDTIAKFLEYMVTEFGDGDLDKWTREEFKGYLVELPVKGMEDKIQYTLWDHFSNEDANYKPHRAYDMMLPILTLPKNAAYIISTPVQYIIGAERSYIENPDDNKQQSILRRRIQSYANRMSDYYNTAYKLLRDPKLFNDIHTFHLDKRFAYDENGALVYQQVGTEEPFHKNFNEVTNRWQTSDGNAAVAWGDRIDWSAEGLLDGYIDANLANELNKPVQEYTYHTFTHETAHNIDARLFLKNNGRRFDAGGEDYADSNLMQSFGPNDIVMNLSVYFDKGTEVGSSLTPERINTPEKIHDFYDKVFQTIYVMDYLEAKAFLQLSSEDKEEIGIKVTYPNEEKYQALGNKYRARQTTGFNQITASEWEKMNLTSINDLIDNKIMKYAGVYKYSSRGSNSYGGEGINTAHWYQPNNPDGRPDSYALKWLAYEMLGYKGYQDGYVEYYSNIHSIRKSIYKNIDKPENGMMEVDYKTDDMAIQRISNQEYQNIDEYKKARFKEVEDKLPYLRKINANEYVQKLYDALVKDALATRTTLAEKMEKDPNCLNNYWCRVDVVKQRSYPESTKVRQEIYYTLKELTNDFEEEIYADEIQQKIDLKINK